MNEVSAGAVIVKKIRDVWNVLLIHDMKHMRTFPKGMIEKNETALEAAVREAHEETGITDIHYQAPLGDVQYIYTRDAATIHKIVHYFLFTYDGFDQLKPQTEEGISDLVWVSFEEALKHIGYPSSNKPILIQAQQKLFPNN